MQLGNCTPTTMALNVTDILVSLAKVAHDPFLHVTTQSGPDCGAKKTKLLRGAVFERPIRNLEHKESPQFSKQ
jgi:hypothetical protein